MSDQGEAEFWELFGEWGIGRDGEPLQLWVRTVTGQGSRGPILAEPVSLPGIPQVAARQLVRASDGNTVVATGTVLCAPLRLLDTFTVNSRVTLDTGRETTVTGVSVADQAELFEFVRVDLA